MRADVYPYKHSQLPQQPVYIKPGKHLLRLYSDLNNPRGSPDEKKRKDLTLSQQRVLRALGRMSRPTIEKYIAMAQAGVAP